MKCALIICLLALVASISKVNATVSPASQNEPWTHETATVNGIKLHYAATGQGQVILFLHGFPEFWYAWKNQLPIFGKCYRAIAADMRGYNLSDKPVKLEDYAVPKLIEDIQALLNHVSKGKKAILVAHDWGGAIAWAYASMHPETLERLVIINAPHPTIFARELRDNPKQQIASGYMNFFRSADAETLLSANDYAGLANAVFGGVNKPGAFSEDDKRKYKEAWSRPGALTGGLNYYRAAQLGPPSKEATPGAAKPALSLLPELKVNVPTLVIWGEKDTALLTGNLDGLDKLVPKLTIKRVPNAGHWIVHEEPDLINKTILDFLHTTL
jgi:pimeloyl-ACP methyl ester carboxylesterase